MSVKTYDPRQVIIIVAGNQMSGYADGSFVTVARNEDMFTLQVGTSGEGTRSKSNNRSGTITFQLMQSSDSNAVLQALANVDELSNAGAVPVMVKDNSGDSLYIAETAWIRKIPDSEFSREAGPREWVLETDVLVPNVAGN